jgi:hypothetical protein
MPFKANAARRHHIPRQTRKVTNWAAYNTSLRQRANLTIWFSKGVVQKVLFAGYTVYRQSRAS